jgi:anti-sigma regulatory factor (Ser/Thr protein kinase)
VTLPGVPGSVPAARRAIRDALGADHPAHYAAAICASELVTNAILYTRSGLTGGQVTLCLTAVRGSIEIRVYDQGARDGATVQRPAGEHGRGLAIVAGLAAARGLEPSGPGQVAWCRIAIPQAHAPRRNRHRS